MWIESRLISFLFLTVISITQLTLRVSPSEPAQKSWGIGNYLIGSKKAGWQTYIPSIQAGSSLLISERSRALPRNIRAACPTAPTAVSRVGLHFEHRMAP